MSDRVCERCGSPHFVEYSGRQLYLCDACYPRTRVLGAACGCGECAARAKLGQSLEELLAETGELAEVRSLADAKRRRLEAAGWRVGSAAEFLRDVGADPGDDGPEAA